MGTINLELNDRETLMLIYKTGRSMSDDEIASELELDKESVVKYRQKLVGKIVNTWLKSRDNV